MPVIEKSKTGIAKMSGGAKRARTADLYTASVALSQLSYSPMLFIPDLVEMTPTI